MGVSRAFEGRFLRVVRCTACGYAVPIGAWCWGALCKPYCYECGSEEFAVSIVRVYPNPARRWWKPWTWCLEPILDELGPAFSLETYLDGVALRRAK